MRSLRIVKKTVNTAVVEQCNPDGIWEEATAEIPLRDAMAYNVKNRQELKVYKVGQTLDRRNGKRHQAQVIYAPNDWEALEYFGTTVCGRFPDGLLELCTGDWRTIAVRPAGDTNIYMK